jgi:hypothetical protein
MSARSKKSNMSNSSELFELQQASTQLQKDIAKYEKRKRLERQKVLTNRLVSGQPGTTYTYRSSK